MRAAVISGGVLGIEERPDPEPGTGEVNFGNVYRALARLKYRGVIAMEFYPTGNVVETLRHAREEALRAWVG